MCKLLLAYFHFTRSFAGSCCSINILSRAYPLLWNWPPRKIWFTSSLNRRKIKTTIFFKEKFESSPLTVSRMCRLCYTNLVRLDALRENNEKRTSISSAWNMGNGHGRYVNCNLKWMAEDVQNVAHRLWLAKPPPKRTSRCGYGNGAIILNGILNGRDKRWTHNESRNDLNAVCRKMREQFFVRSIQDGIASVKCALKCFEFAPKLLPSSTAFKE